LAGWVCGWDHGGVFQVGQGLSDSLLCDCIQLAPCVLNLLVPYGYDLLTLHRAPITELMKTPSRTRTTKKTRATTAIAKDRTDKVKGLNARLGLSPASNKSNSHVSDKLFFRLSSDDSKQARQPFSPLQPRSLNTVAVSPLIAVSPSKAAKPMTTGKGKAKAENPEKPAKGKAKGKRGRRKKGKENEGTPPPAEDEELTEDLPAEQERAEVRFDDPPDGALDEPEAVLSEHEEEREAIESPHDQPPNTAPSPEPSFPAGIADSIVETNHVSLVHAAVQIDTLRPVSLAATIVSGTTDLSMIDEAEEENSSALARATGKSAVPDVPPVPARESETNDTQTEPHNEILAHQQIVESTRFLEPPADSAFEAEPANITSSSMVPTQIQTGAALPVRQVRSSWLSKALGTGTVPIMGLPNASSDNSALQKSYAAPSQRPNPIDFTGLRQSLAPVGGLKRKSDVGLDEDEEEEKEETRPEKVAKVDAAVIIAHRFEVEAIPVAEAVPAVEAIPMVDAVSWPPAVPPLSTRLPAPSVSSSQARVQSIIPEPPMSLQNPRSDIHKVTRALDELRERAQAKELAKQRSAPKATSTGSGFLRGLGNLGRSLGLGGSAKTAEEEAERIEEERKAEIEAQEELERLMNEVSNPVPPIYSVERSPPPVSALSAVWAGDFGEDEVEEVVEVFDDFREAVEIQPSRTPEPQFIEEPQFERRTTRPRLMQAVESTTPVATPPRTVLFVSEAPAIHSRPEKHLHPSPAKAPKVNIEQATSQAVEDPEPLPTPAAQTLSTVAIQQSGPNPVVEEIEDDHGEAKEEYEGGQQVPTNFDTVASVSYAIALIRGFSCFAKSRPWVPSSSSSSSLAPSHHLAASTSSQATSNGLLSHASTIAGKTLGFKPSTGPVRSLQLAAAAAKKVCWASVLPLLSSLILP